MTTHTTNRVHELGIDEAGELARFHTARGSSFIRAKIVEVSIAAEEEASYRIEFGTRDAGDDDEIIWFDLDDSSFEYSSTTDVHDAWQQSREFLRIMITEPATAGSTAQVTVAEGR